MTRRSIAGTGLVLVLVAGFAAWRSAHAPRSVLEEPAVRSGPVAVEASESRRASPGAGRASEAAPARAGEKVVAGAVLEAETEEPLVGFVVELRSTSAPVAQGTTDEHGRFRLSLDGSWGGEVRVQERDGFSFDPAAVAYTGVEREIVFHGRRFAPLRTVTGRVIDALTKEPVPRVVVVSATGTPRAETGEDGVFRLDVPANVESPSFRVFDGDELPVKLGSDSRADQPVLEVEVGPTYRLDITRPADCQLSDLRANLAPAESLAFFPPGVGEGFSPPAFIRADDPPWVRFSVPSHDFPRQTIPGWILRLSSKDRVYMGKATVQSITGICPEIVPVAIARQARLRGRVTDSHGEAPGQGVVMSFRPVGPEASISQVRVARIHDDGSYEIEWLEPGDGVLVAESSEYRTAQTRITIRAGEETVLDLALERLAPAGDVSGRVLTSTGRKAESFRIVLVPEHDLIHGYNTEPVWNEIDGRSVGTFVIHDMPAGEYDLTVSSTYPCRFSRKKVSPPAEDIEILVEDDLPTETLRFRLVDAATGEPIEDRYILSYQTARTESRRRVRGEGPVVTLEHEIVGDAMQWALRADGFAATFGDEKDFTTEKETSGEPERVAVLRLSRGWGAEFRVASSDDSPINGAHIRLDGQDEGVTGPDGVVRINREKRPERIEVLYRDWVLTGGSVRPDGRFTDLPEISVQMHAPR